MEKAGEAKVCYFEDSGAGIDEDVFRFDISMHNSVLMQIVDSR